MGGRHGDGTVAVLMAVLMAVLLIVAVVLAVAVVLIAAVTGPGAHRCHLGPGAGTGAVENMRSMVAGRSPSAADTTGARGRHLSVARSRVETTVHHQHGRLP